VQLENIVQRYIDDCKKTKTYLKNFGTFLNNLPDITPEKCNPEQEMIAPMFEQNPYAKIRREAQEEELRLKGVLA